MTVGIMQPYIFPYIGYFQLIKLVDKFIVYDDVSFIKQGWINRNRILLNAQPFIFTIPIKSISSFTLIQDVEISYVPQWQKKLLRTFEQTYSKAPYFKPTYNLIESLILLNVQHISDLAVKSICSISDYLGIKHSISIISELYDKSELKSQERVIDICLKEQAKHYINPIGGITLYSKEVFESNGIKLDFIKPLPISYKQFNHEFAPWLSIIDVMMFNSPEQINSMLDNYELV